MGNMFRKVAKRKARDSVRLINNFYKPLDFIVPVAIALTSKIALASSQEIFPQFIQCSLYY
jgi:hypothetical protein